MSFQGQHANYSSIRLRNRTISFPNTSASGPEYSESQHPGFCKAALAATRTGSVCAGKGQTSFLLLHSICLKLRWVLPKEQPKPTASAPLHCDTKLLSLTAAISPEPLYKPGVLCAALISPLCLLPAVLGTQGILETRTKHHSLFLNAAVRTQFKLML